MCDRVCKEREPLATAAVSGNLDNRDYPCIQVGLFFANLERRNNRACTHVLTITNLPAMSIVNKYHYQKIAEAPLPFKVRVSFEAMFNYWKDIAAGDDKDRAAHAQKVLDSVAHAKEIHSPFDDFTLLNKYEDEITRLFAPLFPESLWDNEIKALTLPFRFLFFNPTPRLRRIIDRSGDEYDLHMRNMDLDNMYIFSCTFLLNTLYQAGIDSKQPVYFDIPDKEAGVVRHYRAFFNGDFATFNPNEKARELSREDIRLLIDNYNDCDLWKEMIPPESYDFEGFGLVSMFDVTADESLSAMKNILLQRNALRSNAHLEQLQANLQSYCDINDVNLGFASFEPSSRKLRLLTNEEWGCRVMENGDVVKTDECFCEESFRHVFSEKEMLVVSDVEKFKEVDNALFKRMRRQSVQSFIIHPLEYNHEIIGFVELTSKTPYVLNSVVANKLKDITDMYAIAMKRTLDERETKLEAIVQEKFTSIHPSVSWRFFEVANNILESRDNGTPEVSEEVVFRDVVPLYGQFDIRGSSDARNVAIQSDLVYQLTNAEDVMQLAREQVQLPIYDQLRYRIRKYRTKLENGLNAGDEVKILDFLNAEIYPVFNHLAELDTQTSEAVKTYMSHLDSTLNVVYDKRKKYEDSVTMINESISDTVETRQAEAQKMFPHYFEKYKTDGVEYDMYIGQSLLQSRKYDPVYLRNLRLWQLLLTYQVESQIHELQGSLPVKLEIASLILVHSSPLSIKFRQDEKKFDVDGAYNIRYEIVKKRIDKAFIKGTTERLTQPGMLSIVYSHDPEQKEYRRYLEYTHAIGMTSGPVESLELEDLQGTAGLKALRTEITYDSAAMDTVHLEKAIQEMS